MAVGEADQGLELFSQEHRSNLTEYHETTALEIENWPDGKYTFDCVLTVEHILYKLVDNIHRSHRCHAWVHSLPTAICFVRIIEEYGGGDQYPLLIRSDTFTKGEEALLKPFERRPLADFPTLDAAENHDAAGGIWSDGTTMWVADHHDDKIYAYDMANRAQVKALQFYGLGIAGNEHAEGIWSDGTTMWVADHHDDKIYAYDMVTADRVPGKDFEDLQEAGNDYAKGIWSDGSTMWVADRDQDLIYAYSMAAERWGSRVDEKDFKALSVDNKDPEGIWSDGSIMWVADHADDHIYAYSMTTKTRVTSKEFKSLNEYGNEDAGGIWSDGTTMWVGGPQR